MNSTHLAELVGPRARHPEPELLAVMYTDMAESTRYARTHGSRLHRYKIESHNAIVLPLVTEHDGALIRVIGDATQTVFADARHAARCAIDIQRHLEEYNRADDATMPDHRIHVRIGIDFGHTLRYTVGDQTELAGNSPNVAARVIKARGKQADCILISSAFAARLLGDDGFRVTRGNDAPADGFGSLRVHELLWREGALPRSAESIDDHEKQALLERAEDRDCLRAVSYWLPDERVIAPIRLRLQKSRSGIHHPVAGAAAAAAERAIEDAFAVLRDLGWRKASTESLGVAWSMEAPFVPDENDPAIGMAVALAAVAAVTGAEIDPRLVVAGSVYRGNVSLLGSYEERFADLTADDCRVLIVPHSFGASASVSGPTVLGVKTIADAVEEVFGAVLGLGTGRLLGLARRPKIASREYSAAVRLDATAVAGPITRGGTQPPTRSDNRPQTLEAPGDGYLTVLALDTGGEATLLFPGAGKESEFVNGGWPWPYSMGDLPVAREKPGVMRLVAFTTAAPLPPAPADLVVPVDGQARLRPEGVKWLMDNISPSLAASRVETIYVTSDSSSPAVRSASDPFRVRNLLRRKA